MTKTIAELLHDKEVAANIEVGPVVYDQGTYTFEDGSKAIQITSFKDCKPFLTRSLSTLAKQSYKVWKAL